MRQNVCRNLRQDPLEFNSGPSQETVPMVGTDSVLYANVHFHHYSLGGICLTHWLRPMGAGDYVGRNHADLHYGTKAAHLAADLD